MKVAEFVGSQSCDNTYIEQTIHSKFTNKKIYHIMNNLNTFWEVLLVVDVWMTTVYLLDEALTWIVLKWFLCIAT